MLQNLTQQQLKEVLHYNELTGMFTWLSSGTGRRPSGYAGTTNKCGYSTIEVYRKSYKAHRLAWLYIYGVWPKDQIDHINGVKDDNSIINLREATNAENRKNTSTQRNNTSGHRGVSWYKLTNTWVAQAGLNGKRKHLGYFSTIELAADAYNAHAREHHGEFRYQQ